MPIINQNLDPSQKKDVAREREISSVLGTGVTVGLLTAPYNCLLQGVNTTYLGLSGSPVHSLSVLRFAGGLTAIGVGVTLTAQDYGTSGAQGFSLAQPGFSLLANDLLILTTGVANTAVGSGMIEVVISALDDIRQFPNTVG